jgi:hypothetical protein
LQAAVDITNALKLDPMVYGGDTVLVSKRKNGLDGDTSSTDESQAAHALTFVGNAQIDTAQSKFGGSSLLLDGSGDRVTTPNSVGWQLGSTSSSPWTIECWGMLGRAQFHEPWEHA